MTMTKRQLMAAIESADMDAVIYVDDGISSHEIRNIDVVENASIESHFSPKPDDSLVEDGSIILRKS